MSQSRRRRSWVRDPFLFALALVFLGFSTVALAITGRLFREPALVVLAVLSVAPAFWLFYLRARLTADDRPTSRARR